MYILNIEENNVTEQFYTNMAGISYKFVHSTEMQQEMTKIVELLDHKFW